LSASLFSGGTTADYDEIKIFARSHHNLPSAQERLVPAEFPFHPLEG
jgi:hypothetical protein